MKELVVISGKGGTGKTSVVAAFAMFAQDAVLADCDVDAADLHLILDPTIGSHNVFRAGFEAVIRQKDCIGCGGCLAYCRFKAVQRFTGKDAEGIRAAERDPEDSAFIINPLSCEGCGVCVDQCPEHAIDFVEQTAGEWYISDTRYGPMVHARLNIAAENSGKLVSVVRQHAKAVAQEQKKKLILVDGPPGIGCPVIAAMADSSQVLIVTEPTCSGAHDFERVVELTQHFKIPAAVCVNKWDINADMTETIESRANALNVTVAGRIRYDRAVTAAQVQGQSVVEYQTNGCAQDIRNIWDRINTNKK